jgi:pilus assembly protein FimV
MGMAAHQETVDPVVEADTFLAFGRDAQAEEILLEALKTEPQRQAIHLKLLDIYSARKSVSQFEGVAKELHVLTGGAGPDWEKAASMGAVLDSANSLYGAASESAPDEVPAAVDMQATTILRTPAAAEMPTEQTAAMAPAASDSAGLDFDLDIGTTDTASGPAAAVAVAEPESSGLDFDLDLGSPAPAAAADSPQAAAKAEDISLDIAFDMPANETPAPALDFPLGAETPSAAPLAPVAVAEDSGGIDFDFDLGTPETAAATPLPEMSLELPAPAAQSVPAALEIDLGGISLELDTPAAAAADIPDNPEVATKLELAMAYEEMGDRDGARELFQEALAEGSPAQQKTARVKLDGLG